MRLRFDGRRLWAAPAGPSGVPAGPAANVTSLGSHWGALSEVAWGLLVVQEGRRESVGIPIVSGRRAPLARMSSWRTRRRMGRSSLPLLPAPGAWFGGRRRRVLTDDTKRAMMMDVCAVELERHLVLTADSDDTDRKVESSPESNPFEPRESKRLSGAIRAGFRRARRDQALGGRGRCGLRTETGLAGGNVGGRGAK